MVAWVAGLLAPLLATSLLAAIDQHTCHRRGIKQRRSKLQLSHSFQLRMGGGVSCGAFRRFPFVEGGFLGIPRPLCGASEDFFPLLGSVKGFASITSSKRSFNRTFARLSGLSAGRQCPPDEQPEQSNLLIRGCGREGQTISRQDPEAPGLCSMQIGDKSSSLVA